ncbi:hypothetical protein GJV44_00603 [Candidatus Vallotia cooleyia]|nr:hypothetical protein GJV44_00603 [Candidatus Vallotia cooleyia]
MVSIPSIFLVHFIHVQCTAASGRYLRASVYALLPPPPRTLVNRTWDLPGDFRDLPGDFRENELFGETRKFLGG